MRSRPLRACLSLLLVLALVGMMPAHAAMAVPLDMQGMPDQRHVLHGQMQMTDDVTSQHAASHSGQHGQHDQCQCSAHCGACGACHSTVSAELSSNFIAFLATPSGPRPLNPAEIWLPIDPRPPRA